MTMSGEMIVRIIVELTVLISALMIFYNMLRSGAPSCCFMTCDAVFVGKPSWPVFRNRSS